MDASYDKSATSSVLLFPSLVINPHSLSPLSHLLQKNTKGPLKVNILVAILEMEGPHKVSITKGVDRGREISVLKMLVSDESSAIFKLTAWREAAEAWGGELQSSASQVSRPRRGDAVYIESASYLQYICHVCICRILIPHAP